MPPRLTLDDARRALEQGRLDEAEAAALACTRKDKRDANAWQILGLVNQHRGWFGDAARCFEHVVKQHPKDPVAHCRLASAHMYDGRFDLAARGFDRALAISPGQSLATRGKAELLERSGDGAGALALITSLGEHDDADAETCLLHAQLLLGTGDIEGAIGRADRALDHAGLHALTRRKLLFTRGRALERAERYDDAFAAYTAANAEQTRPYDRARTERQIDRLMSSLPIDTGATGDDSDLPVFVVGMPRSGSTLAEQIIDAHPLAYGVGETPAFNDVVRELNR